MTFRDRKMTRRDFVKHSSISTIGLAAGISTLPGCSTVMDSVRAVTNSYLGTQDPIPDEVTPIATVESDIRSTLSVVQSADAVHSSGKIEQEVVQQMFDQAILSYTGKASIEAAWAEIIPGLQSTDTIGIKINCINPSLPSSPEVVNAIINHLVMLGLNENNIIVWDRDESRMTGVGSLKRSGYTFNNGDKGVRYVTTSTDNIGYDSEVIVEVPSADLRFDLSKILSRECKYLINVPQLRHHGKSGMTLCLKNYFGTIPLFDTFTLGAAAKMHKANCNPAIPELYNNGIIKEKTKLHVCDALFTIFESGPMGSPQQIIGKLMVGKDPVALDYLGFLMVEEERMKRGLDTLIRRSKYIQKAAEMGIGTNNPGQMDIKQITV